MKIKLRKEGKRTRFNVIGEAQGWPSVGRSFDPSNKEETETFMVSIPLKESGNRYDLSPYLRLEMSREELQALTSRAQAMLACK
jgi:hypothetical protein